MTSYIIFVTFWNLHRHDFNITLSFCGKINRIAKEFHVSNPD